MRLHFGICTLYLYIKIKKLEIPDIHNIIIPLLKHKLKTHLLSIQLEGSAEEWNPVNTDWDIQYLPKTEKFGCVGRGDLTCLFFSKVVKY